MPDAALEQVAYAMYRIACESGMPPSTPGFSAVYLNMAAAARSRLAGPSKELVLYRPAAN